MTLPPSRVAYYGLIFIGIILAFIFHVFTVAGQYWTRIETINGTEVYWHSGLWKYCEDHYSYQKCERLNNVTAKLKVVQAFMVVACLSWFLSLIVFVLTCTLHKKLVSRTLTLSFFITAVYDLIGMICYTNLQKDKPEEMKFGWSYHMGWVAMGSSMGLALFTISNECLEPVKQPVRRNVFQIAQENYEATDKIQDVNSNQVLYVKNDCQVNPVGLKPTKEQYQKTVLRSITK